MASTIPSPLIVDLRPSAPPRPRFVLRQGVLLTVLASLVLLWSGYRRVPCGAETGTAFYGSSPSEAAAEKTNIRVGSFNIHGGKGRDGRIDLARTAACLQGLDLIGLNEVYGRLYWESADQAESLARLLKLPWLFVPAERRWGHNHFGNAMLCSLPIRSWERLPLPRRYGHSCRNLVLLAAAYRNHTLHVVVTHLDRSDDRERSNQFHTVAELFLALAEPVILLGDLNTTGDDALLSNLLNSPGVRDPLAEVLGDRTPPRIDWLLTRGLDTVDAGLIKSDASDHPCVWAELTLAGDGNPLAR